MQQLLLDRKKNKSNYLCPIIFVTFAYKFHLKMQQLLWDRKKNKSNYLCPIIFGPFAYKFHTLNVTTIMGQKKE